MSYLEHLSNGTASTTEQQRAVAEIKALEIQQSMSPSEMCKKFHLQNCHCCERMWCNDNVSSVKDELIKRNKEIERLNNYILCLLTIFPEETTPADAELLNERDEKIKELKRSVNVLTRMNENQKESILDDIKQFDERKRLIHSQLECIIERNKEITKLRRQRDLFHKYAEIHGDKFFLYAPLEKEYLELLNEIDMED